MVTDSRSGHTLSGMRVPTYDMHGGRPMSPAAVGKEDVERWAAYIVLMPRGWRWGARPDCIEVGGDDEVG